MTTATCALLMPIAAIHPGGGDGNTPWLVATEPRFDDLVPDAPPTVHVAMIR